MKILFVSMHSIHAVRWVDQLIGEGHQLYWFDVLDRGTADFNEAVVQFTGWRKNKIPLRGKSTFKRLFPAVYKNFQSRIEVTVDEAFNEIIKAVEPDLVHSFEMQHCTAPLLDVMNSHVLLPWLYSCWGSDLFYFKKDPKEEEVLKAVLSRVDSIHTDCHRDFEIAVTLGFKGNHFGVFPGGGGYQIADFRSNKLAVSERKTITLKGYQHTFGKALSVIEAFKELPEVLAEYRLEVFSAHDDVVEACASLHTIFREVQVYDRATKKSQAEMMKMMGRSLIYIGNSISDGMPNTLLEALIMGAFPLQSNPGGVTEEVIEEGKNGFLIASPENPSYIATRITTVLKSRSVIEAAYFHNEELSMKWEYNVVKDSILKAYNQLGSGRENR